MKLINFLCCFICIPAMSQVVNFPATSAYAGNTSYSQHYRDLFSYKKNIASIYDLKNPAAGISYERRFLLREMQQLSGAVAYPLKASGAILAFDHFGGRHFSQTKLSVGYGRSLSRLLAMGIQFDYHRLSVPGYGSASAIGFEIASMLFLSEKFTAGIHLDNPLGSRFFKNAGEKIQSIYTIGLGFEASSQCLVVVEITKPENQGAGFTAGVHYALLPRLFVRLGTSTITNLSFAGVGLSFDNIRFDLSTTWHPQGGMSPLLQFIFDIKARKEEIP